MAFLPVGPDEFVEQCMKWVQGVIRPHAVPMPEGGEFETGVKYFALDVGDGIGPYSIADGAPPTVAAAVEAFNDLRVLQFQLSDENKAGPELSFIIGSVFSFAQHAQRVLDPTNPRAAELGERLLKNCAKGGAATKKTGDEEDELIRNIYAEFKRAGLTNNGAYTRTAAKLLTEHSIEMSISTVRRRVANAQR